jgi:type I restriction enzyme S subunit
MSAEFTELGSVAEFINGAAFKPEDWGEEGNRIIRIQNLTDPTKPYNRTKREIPNRLQVQPGDLLVSWSATLGVFEWSGPDVALLNQHIFRVLPDERCVDKRYLRHGLELALIEMQRHLHGATMQHVNRGEFLSTKIYLPSVEEQRRIAAILDAAEALREKRRQSLAKLDTFTQSIFLDLFGDPIENPRRFKVKPLIEIVDPARPISYGILMPGPEQKIGIAYVRVVDMKEGSIDLGSVRKTTLEISNEFRRSLLKPGDILLSIRGHVGRLAIVPTELDGANITQDTARLAVKGAEAVFVCECLRAPGFQRWMTKHTKGAAVRGINLGDVKLIPITLPPLPLQREFAAQVSAVERLKTAQRASLAKLDALFASLQHHAFRGEL